MNMENSKTLQLLTSKKRKANNIVETVMKQAAELMGTLTENQQPTSTNPSPPGISASERLHWEEYDRTYGGAIPNNHTLIWLVDQLFVINN